MSHVHHTGVITAHGGHQHIDHPHHFNNIFARAVQEAKDAGYEIVHAGITSDGNHHGHGHHSHGESGARAQEQSPA